MSDGNKSFPEGFEDRVNLSVTVMIVTLVLLGVLTLGQILTCSLKQETEATEI